MLNYLEKNCRNLSIVFLWFITIITSSIITLTGKGFLILSVEFIILILLLKLIKLKIPERLLYEGKLEEKPEHKKDKIEEKLEDKKEKIIDKKNKPKGKLFKYTFYLRNGKKEIIEATDPKNAFQLFKFTNIPFKNIEFQIKCNGDSHLWDIENNKWVKIK